MKYFIPIILLIILTLSCSRREYQTPLELEFKASSGLEITTQRGNTFRIPPNCFEDEKGINYEGKVKFKLIEVFSKGEMLEYDLTTTSDGKMLVSGGMFYLSAKSESGGDLKLKESASIGLCAMLLPSENRYEEFYGEKKDEDFNWTKATKKQSDNFSDNSVFYHTDDCLDAFTFNISALGWINCDYFENGNLEGNLAVKTDEKNLKVRLVFSDLNSIMEFHKVENEYQLKKLPLSRKAKIIAYKEQNSKVIFYEKEVTIDTMQVFEIALEELSVEEFKAKIKNL